MTDLPNSPYEAIEGLLSTYEAGISNPSSTEFLVARSELEAQVETMVTSQADKLAKLDRQLASKSAAIAAQLGDQLRAGRADRSSSHWWWFLDVVAPAADYMGPKPPSSRDRLINNLLNVFMVVALGIALFVLGRNLGIIPTPKAPTATPFPSFTPAPTATLNPSAIDFSTAKITKTANEVLSIPLPAGWAEGSRSRFGSWEYVYPAEDPANASSAPLVSMAILLDTPISVYGGVLGLSQSFDTPEAALKEFKTTASAQGTLTLGEVTATKIGTIDGSALAINVPPGQNNPSGSQVEIRAANLEGGKIVMVLVQSNPGYWDQFKPVIEQMISGITLKPANIPTATPTATLFDLQITATALQKQFIALTPTNTATVPPTVTPGGPTVTPAAATEAATVAATAAVTEAATVAPTTAATATEAATATAAATEAATAVQ